jgi:hypothetical protein
MREIKKPFGTDLKGSWEITDPRRAWPKPLQPEDDKSKKEVKPDDRENEEPPPQAA